MNISYHFDRAFCALLNKLAKVRSNDTVSMPSQTLSRYHKTIYEIREKHFIERLETKMAELEPNEKLVFICGNSHSERIYKHFNR